MASKTSAVEIPLASLLRPIARLCVRRSIQLNEIIDAFKRIMVEVAREEMQKRGDTVSVSRLSVITGVHRKDVTRFEQETDEKKPRENLISRIIVQWQHNKKFQQKSGKPKILEAEGRYSEFAKLVESVTGGDLGSYPVLFEMERLGVIERKGTKVKLNWRDFVATEDVTESLSMLANDSDDLACAVYENIFDKPEQPNLHLKTSFDSIDQSCLPKIRKWLLEEGSIFHRKVRTYLSNFDSDINLALKSSKKTRVSFGSFSFIEEENSK